MIMIFVKGIKIYVFKKKARESIQNSITSIVRTEETLHITRIESTGSNIFLKIDYGNMQF